MTSYPDKMILCDELKREKRMRSDQIAELSFLEKGQCFIAETARIVKKVQFTLPRTMFWKKDNGNFYTNIWPKYVGDKWLYVEETEDYLDLRCEEMSNKYKEMEDNKKNKKSKSKDIVKSDTGKIDNEVNILQIKPDPEEWLEVNPSTL